MNLDNYQEIKGQIYNINNLVNIASNILPNIDNYGANTTISYSGIFYPQITKLSGGIPYIDKINCDDFVIFEFKIGSKEEMKNFNLLNIHNYSFDITYPNQKPVRCFASVDEGIQFFDKIKEYNTTYKICLTSSKTIAEYYKSEGYIISKIPFNLLKISSFNFLIRLGVLKSNNLKPNVRFVISSTYYKIKNVSDNINKNNYFNPYDLINSWTKPYLPLNNDIYNSVQNNFLNLKNYLIKNKNIISIEQFYPYLSNFVNTNYAIENIFDALSVNPPAQVQANDTGKSYYLTNYINLMNYKNSFLYIISLNHNASNVSLSSNIQIYDTTNLSPITNGTQKTGPDDANILIPYYPIQSIINNNIPTYNVFCYNINNLIKANIPKIIITERIQYSLANFSHIPTNSYKSTACCLILNKPIVNELMYMKKTYNINVKYVTIPLKK